MNKTNIHKTKSQKAKLIFPIVIGGLIFANVLITIFSTAEGTKLGSMEKELTHEKNENRRLGSELIEVSSLKGIKENVTETGFVEPEQVVYLTVEAPLANAN